MRRSILIALNLMVIALLAKAMETFVIARGLDQLFDSRDEEWSAWYRLGFFSLCLLCGMAGAYAVCGKPRTERAAWEYAVWSVVLAVGYFVVLFVAGIKT